MKISYNWLKKYADINLPADEVAQMLTSCGLEVEMTEPFQSIKGGLEGIVIGKVLTCEKHQDSDHLHITTVDIGQTTPLNIVCGAPNVNVNQYVVVATIGTTLYPLEGEPFKIKKSKIRGVESEGMLCAEDEIGLGHSHDGIIVLNDQPRPGTLAKDYFNIENETIFEIGLTPNRSDATSHIGVARDLIALYNIKYHDNKKLLYPDTSKFHGTFKPNISVKVEDDTLCPRYSSICVKNIKVAESPEWLKNKLKSIDIRPVNNVVDVSQFVLFEMGQPLHTFDADKIKGNQVIVKTVENGHPFVTLDGVERKLSDKDLMICNIEEPMCMAGVFGGKNSGINEQSTNVFIESAYFNPVSIRKTSKRHGLKTDASFRYERGCDPQITMEAAKRAALMIQELAGGEISEIQDVYPHPVQPCQIELKYSRLCQLVGKQIDKNTIINILKAIEIEAIQQDDEKATFVIPTNKVDVTREADLIEEFLRIYGYNNVEIPNQINYTLAFHEKNSLVNDIEKISDYLTNNGFSEAINNSLTKAEYAEKFSFINQEETISLVNPLSRDLQNMRQTLLIGGLEDIIHNINHGNENIKLYEFGFTYHKNLNANADDEVTKRFLEKHHLGLWVSGKRQHESWQEKQTEVDFFYLKNMLTNALEKIHVKLSKLKLNDDVESQYLNNAITYSIDNELFAMIGEVKEDILANFDIKQKVFYAEVNCELIKKLQHGEKTIFKDLNRFPEVERDLALLIDKNITYKQIEDLSYKTEKRYLKSINLFDVYQGKNLEPGKKSYAIRYILCDPDKTLTNNEITKIMDKLVLAYERELNAKLRS
jgi:phenylalanyl-tRNA synthetase beta chain